jgi:hypothetical protein
MITQPTGYTPLEYNAKNRLQAVRAFYKQSQEPDFNKFIESQFSHSKQYWENKRQNMNYKLKVLKSQGKNNECLDLQREINQITSKYLLYENNTFNNSMAAEAIYKDVT